MKLSVVIPVYNEQRTIRELISKVKKVKLRGFTKEIIVVNDGSTDGTLRILKKIKEIKLVNHKKNSGKGAAVRSGIRASTGNVLIIQDADLEYEPRDYQKLLEPITRGKAQVVYGTRLKNYPLIFFGNKRTPMPIHLVANKFLTFVTNLVYGASLTDMETCYKMFTKKAITGIKLKSSGFEIEPEITAKLLKSGHKIYEVPIKVKPRSYADGKKIGFMDGLKAIYYLTYFRFFD